VYFDLGVRGAKERRPRRPSRAPWARRSGRRWSRLRGR
jgi:hypothetical protein